MSAVWERSRGWLNKPLFQEAKQKREHTWHFSSQTIAGSLCHIFTLGKTKHASLRRMGASDPPYCDYREKQIWDLHFWETCRVQKKRKEKKSLILIHIFWFSFSAVAFFMHRHKPPTCPNALGNRNILPIFQWCKATMAYCVHVSPICNWIR